MDVSLLVGLISFDDNTYNKSLGNNTVDLRNKAFINLVEEGFNEYKQGEPTRLALSVTPFTNETVDELPEIYKFAHERNIYCVFAPTLLAGKGLDIFHDQKTNHDYQEFIQKTQAAYIRIYNYAIKSNIMSLDTFKKDGASLYGGGHPCNITAAGLYITLSGQVVQCTGRFDKETIFQMILGKKKALKKFGRIVQMASVQNLKILLIIVASQETDTVCRQISIQR